MLHNFWFMNHNLFFDGDYAIKILRSFRWKKYFFKIFIFSGRYPTLKFGISFIDFLKMRGREISKIRFLGQFLTLNNMVLKFSQNSNFSYFLGIKSEIHHYSDLNFRDLEWYNIWHDTIMMIAVAMKYIIPLVDFFPLAF